MKDNISVPIVLTLVIYKRASQWQKVMEKAIGLMMMMIWSL